MEFSNVTSPTLDGVEKLDTPNLTHEWKKSTRFLYNTWRNSLPCKSHSEVADATTTLYILRGYRQENQPWSYYMKSLFFPNNQSMNTWTHFIPFLCFLYRYYCYIMEQSAPFNAINAPFYIHGVGVCIALLASSFAHAFCSKSNEVCRVCFMADFAAIYIYGLSYMVALESYVCPISVYCGGPPTQKYFMEVILSSGLVALVTLSSNYLKCGLALPLRTVVYTTGMFIVYTPCFVRFILGNSLQSNHPTTQLENSSHAFLFFLQFVFLGVATSFYVLRYPEAHHPGNFDVMGNSHNWFHIFSALSMYVQSYMLEEILGEIKLGFMNKKLLEEDFGITWWGTLGPTVLSIFLHSGLTLAYAYMIFLPDKSKLD